VAGSRDRNAPPLWGHRTRAYEAHHPFEGCSVDFTSRVFPAGGAELIHVDTSLLPQIGQRSGKRRPTYWKWSRTLRRQFFHVDAKPLAAVVAVRLEVLAGVDQLAERIDGEGVFGHRPLPVADLKCDVL
jgi:hypothetical protein